MAQKANLSFNVNKIPVQMNKVCYKAKFHCVKTSSGKVVAKTFRYSTLYRCFSSSLVQCEYDELSNAMLSYSAANDIGDSLPYCSVQNDNGKKMTFATDNQFLKINDFT